MQPSDNLSFAVSRISEARFSPHILSKKKPGPAKPNVLIKNDVYGVPLLSPWSHRFPCQTEPFSAKFLNRIGGSWEVFSATSHLPPQPERVHSARERCVLTETAATD